MNKWSQDRSNALDRVREFAASIRRGLSGESPRPGVAARFSNREMLARQAGEAAAPILNQEYTGDRRNGKGPYGKQVSALARQRTNSDVPGNRPGRFGSIGPR